MTTDVAERKVKRTTFSCSVCGGAGFISVDDPAGMGFTLDPRDAAPRRHKAQETRTPQAVEGPGYSEWGRPTF